MRKAPILALAAAGALALGGAAVAAERPASHVMDVALPDGSTAHILYYGNVAPKVTIARVPFAWAPVGWAPMALPGFGNLDAVMAQMERQREAMIRQVELMSRQATTAPGAPLNMVSYGSAPAGSTSVSVVSVSNGGGTCTRTTRVTSLGAGKPPKVETAVSGSCSGGAAAPAPQARQPALPLDRT